MIKQHLSYLLLVILTTVQLSAQQDSLSLLLDELKLGDLKEKDQMTDDQKMITGGRFLQNKDELPYTAFIVTKEEILDNGYITLTDVMKSLPGIRVSQSGSGVEGETFMLRGLLGNSHMKILLNDNPIKPSIVKGMPLGAQLPIRQAERIEIVYGPAAVLYGADASVGVINIITKESERPIYAQADLSVGSQGFSSIDVMFGGKLGKNNHVLRYNVYGSNTVMNTRNIFYDTEELYNPSLYTSQPGIDTNYVNNPNYIGTAFNPEIGSTPHLSRLVGFQLDYKALSFSGQGMYRRDHSSIGLNPLAVSYSDPGNFIGENTFKFILSFQKDYKHWGLKTNVNYLRYSMDNNSSYTYIEDKLAKALNRFTSNIPNAMVRDSIRKLIREEYFSDTRYTYALSNDTRLEQLFYINPTDFMNITAGANMNLSLGLTQAYYLEDRYSHSGIILGTLLGDDSNLQPEWFSFLDWSAFVKTQFNLKKIKGVLGYQFYHHESYGDAHTPQLALLYQVNKSLNFRASYSSAFRVPSAFYSANTLGITLGDLGGENGITNLNKSLDAETTQGFELGLRYDTKSIFKADVSVFHSQTFNFISYNFDNEIAFDTGLEEFTLGYFNDGNTKAILYGIQANLEANWNLEKLKTKVLLNLNYNKGKEILPAEKGTLDLVRGQPNFMGQLNLSFRFWKESFYVNLTNNYVSDFAKFNIVDVGQYNQNKAAFTNDGFYTLDILTRYKISNNFQGYLKIKNALNKKYAGIDASGTIDDLSYNPQALRTFSFGLSYRIE